MKVLLLGAGSLPTSADSPVWIAEQSGRLLIERFVAACQGLQPDLVFAVRTEDIRRFRIDSIIALAAPEAAVVSVSGNTQGAACTALLCIERINRDKELLIINSNELLDLDYAEPVRYFRAHQLDAGVATFPSLHPRYSYALLDDNNIVVEAAEKRPISRNAMAGYYWFARGDDFIIAAQDMIHKNAQVDGQYYISLALNELILRQKRIGIYPIQASQYHPLKSRQQISLYEAEGVEAVA